MGFGWPGRFMYRGWDVASRLLGPLEWVGQSTPLQRRQFQIFPAAPRTGEQQVGVSRAWRDLRATVLQDPVAGDGVLIGLNGLHDQLRAVDLRILQLLSDGLSDCRAAPPRPPGTFAIGKMVGWMPCPDLRSDEIVLADR
jgi:hypothetical protein